MDKAYLILADGTVFEGYSIGAKGKSIGETVFTTGMTGYIETLTDPSYYGQIVTQTFPLIGNYGVIKKDFESKKSYVKGYIVRELCEKPSNFRCESTLSDFLKSQEIVGIAEIDTRKLTKILREVGVMNGMIASGNEATRIETALQNENEKEKLIAKIKEYKIEDAVKSVQSTDEALGIENKTINQDVILDRDAPLVVLLDFGAKANIQRELEKRGLSVKIVPYNTSAEEIISFSPNGIMLSNGPGDPAENTTVIEEIKKLCEWNNAVIASSANTARKDTRMAVANKTEGEMVACATNTADGIVACATSTASEIVAHTTNTADGIAACATNTADGIAACATNTATAKPIPIFGICLGHQMLALARGAKTCKLKYGHRGGNQPVKDLDNGRVFITSQNHGYAVENDSLPPNAKLRFINTNDGTCEGIEYTDIPAFSVQFHPEACGGPHDTNYLFDLFHDEVLRYSNVV